MQLLINTGSFHPIESPVGPSLAGSSMAMIQYEQPFNSTDSVLPLIKLMHQNQK
jgi:hypothetical protein